MSQLLSPLVDLRFLPALDSLGKHVLRDIGIGDIVHRLRDIQVILRIIVIHYVLLIFSW